MNLIATLRQRQQSHARSVFGPLLVVWLSLSLQACAVAQPGAELAVDRSVSVEMPGLASDHSGQKNDSQSARLPTGETVAVEFIPTKAGEFEFACQMGMLRGKVIVE